MENLALGLLTMMEETGIVEGPRWPTVSVTPSPYTAQFRAGLQSRRTEAVAA
jgi:hypothetical protein